jgi:hypothetical protein
VAQIGNDGPIPRVLEPVVGRPLAGIHLGGDGLDRSACGVQQGDPLLFRAPGCRRLLIRTVESLVPRKVTPFEVSRVSRNE